VQSAAGFFERIGMSREFQERFLREQINEYDRLLIDRASSRSSRVGRNLIKTIEKQKAGREAKLKDLLASDKKDDGLVFEKCCVPNNVEQATDEALFAEPQSFFSTLFRAPCGYGASG
jgi:hypothetical protein